jgi:hypothetical protein
MSISERASVINRAIAETANSRFGLCYTEPKAKWTEAVPMAVACFTGL